MDDQLDCGLVERLIQIVRGEIPFRSLFAERAKAPSRRAAVSRLIRKLEGRPDPTSEPEPVAQGLGEERSALRFEVGQSVMGWAVFDQEHEKADRPQGDLQQGGDEW